QTLLLSALGRKQRCLETTLDSAQMVVDEILQLRKLKSYAQGYEDAEKFYTMANPTLPTGCEMPKAPAEQWIIEHKYPNSLGDSWDKSRDTSVCGTFPSKAEAELAISNDGPAQRGSILRRVTRIAVPENPAQYKKPEQWITEYRRKTSEDVWVRSCDPILRDTFLSREDAQAAVDKDSPNCGSIVRRARR